MNPKSKFFVVIVIIFILFAITHVSACNAQSDLGLNQNMLSVNEIDINDGDLNEKLTESSDKSYDDLYNEVAICNGTVNLEKDYKYKKSDNNSKLYLNNSNLVINGNGHVIDGSNNASGFQFINDNGDITINDLTFKNCKHFSVCSSGKLTLNNVNFINNSVVDSTDGVGIIESFNKNLTVNSCNFYSNLNSTLISAFSSNVEIYNSHFSNTYCTVSPLNIDRNQLVIENSTFENLGSRYGGAIGFKGDYISVKNSIFRNLKADLTGGAILIKFFLIPVNSSGDNSSTRPYEDMLIENCIFSNVSSAHNGGVIYADLESSRDEEGITNFHILNCNFTDAYSCFGGVLADQGGFLDISNVNFINCSAGELGGAIYTSYANLNLSDSNFSICSSEVNAGAIYFDKGNLVVKGSNFISNNVANVVSGKESVIYANDVDAEIINSTFENGLVGIYANFASNSKLVNISSTDLFLLNNTDYIVSVENKGMKLNLTNNTITVDTLPSRFDLRDWGWASPLKYQGDNFACWAFATAGALECSLLKATGVLYNISEDNIQNLQLRYYSEGDTRNVAAGFAYSGLGYSLSWYGIVTSQDDTYDERGMFSSVVQTENRIHLQDAMLIFGGRNETIDLVKQAILKYGAVSIQFSIVSFEYTNSTNYTDEDLQPGHWVTVIGWDDNYPAENFKDDESSSNDTVPLGNGAWLIKDSENLYLNETEGTSMGEGGYLRISYYNPSFLAKDFNPIIPQNAAVAYIFENTIDYHVNYQTDLTGLAGFDGNYTVYSNEFTSKYSELIGAVGTYFNESGINYSFDVYVNDKLMHSQSGVSEFAGFRTIVLNKYIPVNAGDTFKVVFKNNALPYQAYSRVHYISGMSMVSSDGKSFKDITLQNKTVCLKVYTVADDTKIINNKNIAVDYTGGSYFTVNVVTTDGHAVGAGENVKFTINGKTTTVTTDSNGIAKIKITQTPKKYTITTTYKGKSVKNTVTVKQVLTASKVTVKKTAKKFTLKAKLKINSKLVKGKKVTFKLNGKKYAVKTNAKGIAQKVLKKNVIKKLKKGKTYKLKVTYLKTTIKTTVKVK